MDSNQFLLMQFDTATVSKYTVIGLQNPLEIESVISFGSVTPTLPANNSFIYNFGTHIHNITFQIDHIVIDTESLLEGVKLIFNSQEYIGTFVSYLEGQQTVSFEIDKLLPSVTVQFESSVQIDGIRVMGYAPDDFFIKEVEYVVKYLNDPFAFVPGQRYILGGRNIAVWG